jgi:hypothetical protein
MKTTGSNRRAFPRVAAAVPVEIVRPDSIDSRTIRAVLHEISQTGAVVTTDEAIPSGEWIVLRPDRKGAGYGQEVTAAVERNLSPNEPQAKLVCRFPNPLDYATLQKFR